MFARQAVGTTGHAIIIPVHAQSAHERQRPTHRIGLRGQSTQPAGKRSQHHEPRRKEPVRADLGQDSRRACKRTRRVGRQRGQNRLGRATARDSAIPEPNNPGNRISRLLTLETSVGAPPAPESFRTPGTEGAIPTCAGAVDPPSKGVVAGSNPAGRASCFDAAYIGPAYTEG